MNIHPRIIKIAVGLLKFLQLQLFITLISFPILISWGLPISLLSPVGNLIFAPVLTLFLLLSSLIFFTTLLHMPNGLLCFCLEKTTEWWLWFMEYANKSWLYGFAKPSWLILIATPALALCILHFRFIRSAIVSTLCFLALLVATCWYIHHTHSKNNSLIEALPCNRGTVTMIHHANQLVIVDPGVIGQSISAPTWVEYTLIPTILKSTGKTCIDHLILMQPSQMLFMAIAALVQKIEIKHVHLLCWDGTLTKREWAHFFALKQALQENNCSLRRIGTKPMTIHLTKSEIINITILDHIITQKDITYPALQVTAQIGEQAVCAQSYKHKKAALVKKTK